MTEAKKPIEIGGDWGTRTGLFVRKYTSYVSISVRHPAHPFLVKGVNIEGDREMAEVKARTLCDEDFDARLLRRDRKSVV